MTSLEIVQDFVNRGFPHHYDIPGNRVFVTDSTVSTLVYYRDRVVVEYYHLLPNVTLPLHSHPFDNYCVYIFGELTGRRRLTPNSPVHTHVVGPEHRGVLGPVNPQGAEHGFSTGPKGAVIYNIQVWPEHVANPLSAALEYYGPPMGPMHALQLQKTDYGVFQKHD